MIEVIDRMSEQELEVEYAHLLQVSQAISDVEFDEVLADRDEIRSRVREPVDAVELVRAGRDELAERGL